MTSVKENFKVIIAGGSLSGLALANMLERFDIDYVVLEAYGKIPPDVGASLTLLPNGFRILDQLGIYDEFLNQDRFTLQMYHTDVRNSTGEKFRHVEHMLEHVIARHTYPLANWERREWIRLLYNHIKQKEKVIVNKRVVNIVESDDGVLVTTSDGDTFSGDMLVGADGVHSTVREAMWRNAGLEPQVENQKLVANYGCMFGVSEGVKNIPRDGSNQVLMKGCTFMWASGPNNSTYWSFHMKLPKPTYGEEIPRYTKEQLEEIADKHKAMPVTPNVKFGDVFAKAKKKAMVPLQEYTLGKWHHNRIVIIGDSSMKVNPIVGQGGNNAVESAAVLINSLLRKFDEVSAASRKTLTTADLDAVFTEMERIRIERGKLFVKAGQDIQKVMAMETPLEVFISKLMAMPSVLPDDFLVTGVGATTLGGHLIERLPVPKRPRAVPFDDELPAKPIKDEVRNWIASGALAGSLALIYWAAGRTVDLDISLFKDYAGGLAPLQSSYTGVSGIDAILTALVSAVSWTVHGNNNTLKSLSMYFMPQIIPSFLIWNVEGHRIGNITSPLALPSLWGMASQFIGISKIAPLYFGATAAFGDTSSTGRKIDDDTAKAVLPATALGFLLPYTMWFLPSSVISESARQNLIAWSQFAPIYVSGLTMGITAARKWWASRSRGPPPAPGTEEAHKAGIEKVRMRYRTTDARPLKSAYAAAFVAQAVPHALLVGRAFWRIGGSLTVIANGARNLLGMTCSSMAQLKTDPMHSLSVLNSWDLVLYSGASLAFGLYTVWTLRKKGYIRDDEAKKAAIGVAAGQVLCGPGATYTGLWWWREGVLQRLVTL